jgi:hypothetical protein
VTDQRERADVGDLLPSLLRDFLNRRHQRTV